MGRYLEILKRAEAEIARRDKSAQSDRSPPSVARRTDFCRFRRFGRGSADHANALAALEKRCPEWIELKDWQQMIADGRRFIARWGDQASALGWSVSNLFGLHDVPDNPAPNYHRLSRYDETGLIWFLRGRPVIALAENTAAVEQKSGVVTIYRKDIKQAQRQLDDNIVH